MTDNEPARTVNRRAILKGSTALIGVAAVTSAAPAGSAPGASTPSRAAQPSVVAVDAGPIVGTVSGKVIGYVRNGINVFKGIPYAQSTEGANRFMPPVAAKPWTGIRSSRQFGNVAPQGPRAGWATDEAAFMFSWDDGVQGEDCLRINLWSPAVNDGKRRPVMVWLHGGGFTAGSGQELLSYDGENLARRGDVVVVTLNHRLNVFGFLDLSQYGSAYASSANAGMLDIVAALEWVRDNIGAFGGDPKNVTIFGQSGGGGKVSVLMGMPAAKGLFHRAIVQSGSMLRGQTQDKSQTLADEIVRQLGLDKASIGKMQTIPFDLILRASLDVMHARSAATPARLPDFRHMAETLGFAPVVDGRILPAHPFDPQAPSLSSEVPMMIGSTLNEFVTSVDHPELEGMSEQELQQRVHGAFGESAADIIKAFRVRTPSVSPFRLWSRIAASTVREAAVNQARIKAAAGSAPAYLYWFTWQTPILGGRPGAFHCSEIAFAFDNTDRCQNMTGGGSDARALAAIVSESWIHFARSGDPNHGQMPRWAPYSDQQMPTMIFDTKTVLANGPDRSELLSIRGS